MTTSGVYSPTTASNPKLLWFLVPSELLDQTRFGIKLCEVVSSKTVSARAPGPGPPSTGSPREEVKVLHVHGEQMCLWMLQLMSTALLT